MHSAKATAAENNQNQKTGQKIGEKHILKAVDLHKSYKGRKVVRGVSFEVESGQVVGLLGPNGAGKTTSFYMVVGLVHADEGQVLLNDTEISELAMHQRAKSG